MASFSLIFLGLLGGALAYKTGAPVSVCETMMPEHGFAAQKSDLPYSVKIEPSTIAPGGKTTITLQGIRDKKFKGFMIEGRLGNTIIGTFDASGDSKTINCPKGINNAVTHTSSKEKSSIQVTWNAPKDLKEKVIFYVTVAEAGDTYWVKHIAGTLAVQ